VTVDDGQLVRAVDRLVNHVGHWSPARWSARSHPGAAEVVHALAQRLADLEADLTGRPRYPVPWPGSQLALPDQVRVVALDLVWAKPGPEVLAAALDAVEQAHREL
jgi:hypothetical protein